jgi:hypothetical protein
MHLQAKMNEPEYPVAEGLDGTCTQTSPQCASIANTITPATMTHHATEIAKNQVLRITAATCRAEQLDYVDPDQAPQQAARIIAQ